MPVALLGDSVYASERARRELDAGAEHVRRRTRLPFSRADWRVGGPAPDLGPPDLTRSNHPSQVSGQTKPVSLDTTQSRRTVRFGARACRGGVATLVRLRVWLRQ